MPDKPGYKKIKRVKTIIDTERVAVSIGIITHTMYNRAGESGYCLIPSDVLSQ